MQVAGHFARCRKTEVCAIKISKAIGNKYYGNKPVPTRLCNYFIHLGLSFSLFEPFWSHEGTKTERNTKYLFVPLCAFEPLWQVSLQTLFSSQNYIIELLIFIKTGNSLYDRRRVLYS